MSAVWEPKCTPGVVCRTMFVGAGDAIIVVNADQKNTKPCICITYTVDYCHYYDAVIIIIPRMCPARVPRFCFFFSFSIAHKTSASARVRVLIYGDTGCKTLTAIHYAYVVAWRANEHVERWDSLRWLGQHRWHRSLHLPHFPLRLRLFGSQWLTMLCVFACRTGCGAPP